MRFPGYKVLWNTFVASNPPQTSQGSLQLSPRLLSWIKAFKGVLLLSGGKEGKAFPKTKIYHCTTS